MCHNGIVYARTVKGRTLNLAVSGMLWEMSLVMIDQETRSLWSQLLGEAMRGPLKGESLEMLPSVMTDWRSWKTRYPRTTAVAMSRTATDYTRSMHVKNESSFLIGITDGKLSRAWLFADLQTGGVANDAFAGNSVVVVFDPSRGTAVLHGRSVDGRELTFDLKDGKLIDRETGSEWDLISGRAMTRPMKGKQLDPRPGIISYEHAWKTFYPKSSYWKARPQ